ncbi:tetratricopeptide repeat protein [Roseicyclus amphidinii]|uniref:tetratricopeptide repeat protein n=1 Tax=Roseicyclus amphidinii TaxID=3034232 RepID=UPI0024E0AE7D|nr:tetratricopeptide repeat protein [Roseicyclus sp. Amp-Y-6]
MADCAEGLPAPDLEGLRRDLALLAAETGFAYDRVFDRMAGGASIAEALDLPEGTAAAIYALAYARFNAGDIDRALPLFRALVLLGPRGRDHWLGLALCLRGKGLMAEAGTAFATAAALAPDDPMILFHRTELACHTGDWAAAKAGVARFAGMPQTPVWRRLLPEMRKLATAVELRG